MAYFDGIKEGMTIFLQRGSDVVKMVGESSFIAGTHEYDFNGYLKYYPIFGQVAFWGPPPPVVAPPRPKRKVKKEIRGWVRWYNDGRYFLENFDTREVPGGEVYPITAEIEVEED